MGARILSCTHYDTTDAVLYCWRCVGSHAEAGGGVVGWWDGGMVGWWVYLGLYGLHRESVRTLRCTDSSDSTESLSDSMESLLDYTAPSIPHHTSHTDLLRRVLACFGVFRRTSTTLRRPNTCVFEFARYYEILRNTLKYVGIQRPWRRPRITTDTTRYYQILQNVNQIRNEIQAKETQACWVFAEMST